MRWEQEENTAGAGDHISMKEVQADHHPMDVRFDCAEGGCYNLHPADRYPPQAPHFSHFSPPNWNDPENCCIRPQNDGSCFCGGVTCDSVTVNVPQVSVPPVECVSQVSVMNLSSPAEESVPELHQKRRTISLPQECQNVFITYSSDVSSEMVTFVDFLTKQGFRPAIDLFDNPIRRLDISKWTDTYLKDLSTPIIIAISPKYKADTEGSAVDSHGLQTKYINSMIQSQFIQQGCLNFRFIPVLFFGASQKHVPSWLQNTRVYRWPQDTEDLVLRLLREERYVPPPVPVELSLIIRPVTMSAATTLR
ncbi:E3 ubiquitin ligase TRAF3IP2-like isoform X2 [Cololabis saira]|uniref:E3 ubiquitin ligase TRAF3IP2-like isoform X2 n=1 Tax=Cololabis saira TaxID=129043 RepID=UPI002AD3D0B4|nr:E3 ubiquitin ligase TRAF3IP2-like isoform X2 [Cololabis saira]